MTLYDIGDFKVGIYVNNSNRNFQSLNNPRMLHVHVNHGESDKLSSFSNQVKAYDRVFVAGLSMGGTLATRLAQVRPHDVAGLLLVNPALLTQHIAASSVESVAGYITLSSRRRPRVRPSIATVTV